MINPFKQEEKKQYPYSSIEMRKSSGNYWWIVAFTLVVVLIGILYWFS